MMRRRQHIGALLITLCACTASSEGPGASGGRRGEGPGGGSAMPDAVESALTAEEAVEHVTDLLGDVGGFVGEGFAGFGAGGGGGGWQDFLDG